MTAGEAVECGLAAGRVEDREQLGSLLGFDKWTECKGLGTLLSAHWIKVMEKLNRDMKKLGEQFTDNMERSRQVLQDRSSVTYIYYRNSHRMIPDSQRRWRESTILCVQFLRKAEKNLKDGIAVLKKMEGMEALIELLEAQLREVRRLADRVYRSRTDYNVKVEK